MKSALAGSHSGKLRATAKNVVLANDFSIFSSLERLDDGCPAIRTPLVGRLTRRPRARFMLVSAGCGGTDRMPRIGSAAAIARNSACPYIRGETFGLAGHAVETPCVNLCLLDPATGTCLGCRRPLAEIASWASMSDAERRAVMGAVAARLARRAEA